MQLANMLDSEQAENEFRNIKLKLKGPNRHSELQAVKALMAMSAQHLSASVHMASGGGGSGGEQKPAMRQICAQQRIELAPRPARISHRKSFSDEDSERDPCESPLPSPPAKRAALASNLARSRASDKPVDLSRCADSPEPVYGLSINMTEEEFRELAEKEGIEDVIGEPICRLCNKLFSGPLGIALHMCPAMRRQTYRCEICGEDKWKTKANLHSHIKWCKKRLIVKSEQHDKQLY